MWYQARLPDPLSGPCPVSLVAPGPEEVTRAVSARPGRYPAGLRSAASPAVSAVPQRDAASVRGLSGDLIFSLYLVLQRQSAGAGSEWPDRRKLHAPEQGSLVG